MVEKKSRCGGKYFLMAVVMLLAGATAGCVADTVQLATKVNDPIMLDYENWDEDDLYTMEDGRQGSSGSSGCSS